jgi:probable O-glycosylation ligase (exosortase A-associated)
MKGLLFTYLLTYGGALASLFYPYMGLLIYVCFAIVRPESMWYWSVEPGNYSRVVAIALLVGWALGGFGSWQVGRARGMILALVGFWVWGVLGTPLARNSDAALVFVESTFKIILPFLAGVTLINSVDRLKQLAWVIVISQGYVAFELNMSYLGGYNRAAEIGFGGMDNNGLAIGMVTTVGMAFFLGLGSPSWWGKVFGFGSALLMAHVVLFSFSRGGMVALIITGAVGFLLTPRQPRHYAALALAVLLALRLAGPEVRDRFLTVFLEEKERDVSAQSRLDLWRDQADVLLNNPAFGCGPYNWRLIAQEYGWPEGKDGHSLWLQVGAEMGFPGLALLASFYGLCLLRLWPLTHAGSDIPDPWLREAARMVFAALIGFAVSAQFVSVVGLEVPYYVALVGAGALKLAAVPETRYAAVRRPAALAVAT